MPDRSQLATAVPTIHQGSPKDDLKPNRTQTSKTTVGIAIKGVSTHPPDKPAVRCEAALNDQMIVCSADKHAVRCSAESDWRIDVSFPGTLD